LPFRSGSLISVGSCHPFSQQENHDDVTFESIVKAGDKPQAVATLKQAAEAVQKIEDASLEASPLFDIAIAPVLAGEIKQATEVAQEIQNGFGKEIMLSRIAAFLATEPIPENKKDHPNGRGPVVRRMKKAFTPQEKRLAKQIVEAMRSR
jgi:hypothetical protein